MNQKDIKQLAKDIERLRILFGRIIESLELMLCKVETDRMNRKIR